MLSYVLQIYPLTLKSEPLARNCLRLVFERLLRAIESRVDVNRSLRRGGNFTDPNERVRLSSEPLEGS